MLLLCQAPHISFRVFLACDPSLQTFSGQQMAKDVFVYLSDVKVNNRDGNVAQLVECMPSMHEAVY